MVFLIELDLKRQNQYGRLAFRIRKAHSDIEVISNVVKEKTNKTMWSGDYAQRGVCVAIHKKNKK